MTPRRDPANAVSDDVRRLARVVAAAFAPAALPHAVDRTFLDLAISRHRVGPLLKAAADREQLLASPEDLEILTRHAAANARNAAYARLLEVLAVQSLAKAGIPSFVFKGQQMAHLLYPDPLWRHSGDVDMLVEPNDFATAIATLVTATGGPSQPDLSGKGMLASATARQVRDVTIYQRPTKQKIELHQRLFFPRPLSDVVPACDASFRPQMPKSNSDIPAPTIGAGLALYLLMHGAISGWWRLKWLVDLFVLMPRLSPEAATDLPAAAENGGVAASAKAGLRLMQSLFGASLPGRLDVWIDEAAGTSAVNRRLHNFAAQISNTWVKEPSPLGARVEAIRGHLLLEERLGPRLDILVRAPLSSALRMLLGVG